MIDLEFLEKLKALAKDTNATVLLDLEGSDGIIVRGRTPESLNDKVLKSHKIIIASLIPSELKNEYKEEVDGEAPASDDRF